jgi:hypothetical protein
MIIWLNRWKQVTLQAWSVAWLGKRRVGPIQGMDKPLEFLDADFMLLLMNHKKKIK